MPLPNKTELSLAPNNLTMKNLMEKQRDSIQGSGKAYSSTTTYEKYDTSIYDEIEYISIYSDGDTQHSNQQPDVSPTYWQDKRVFDKLSESYVSKITSTDNAISKFNGTTGEIQDTGVTIDDNDFITTQIFNQDGTEFDGVPYADAGLLGVPDTSFSPTGARIYPDGEIRGKSSYGEYTKFPSGVLFFKATVACTGTNRINTISFIAAHSFIGAVEAVGTEKTYANGGKSNITVEFLAGTADFIVRSYEIDESATDNNSRDTCIIAIGEWK